MKYKVLSALFIIILFSFVSVITWGVESSPASEPQVAPKEEENARQLRIFREAVLQGATEEIRVDAAVELLVRNDAASLDVLVTALKSADNPEAQQAVCKALVKSRGLGQAISSRQNFLEPLMQILAVAGYDQAVFAAEALLIFGYSDIQPGLDGLIKTNSLVNRQSRMNAVYALQIRPEPQALEQLIGLLDNSDAEISKAAENALQEAFGIPVGTSRKVWSDILAELKQKSPDDIRRDLLLRQEMKLRQIQAERDRWQKLYLSALDKQYDATDETGRGKMTLEMLSSDLAPVRIWALGKVIQYPAADKIVLRDKLFSLLSDESRDVRLQTARVLNNMSVLNPAQKLLERFKQESDSEVALAIFEALGEACSFAFSPGSPVELSSDIKIETLNIAAQYLAQESAESVGKGAEVIRKLLELNNLSKESIQYYLDIVYQRYNTSVEQDPVLRADLLSMMAHLCGQGSPKEHASVLFEDSFVKGMTVDDNPPLRLAAVKGMTNIDQVKALSLAKKNQLMLDESPAVRQAVIELAGLTGGVDDLDWLLNQMNTNGQEDLAWQAIKDICQRQKSPFLLAWLPRLDAKIGYGDYVRDILELAEQKAAAEKAPESLTSAREKLIHWYSDEKEWEQAVLYLEKTEYSYQGNPFSEQTNAEIFGIYLYAGISEKMVQILNTVLAEKDFVESSPIFGTLSGYLNDDTVAEGAKRLIVGRLMTIKVENRPNWQNYVDRLSSLFGSLPLPDEVSAQNPVPSS